MTLCLFASDLHGSQERYRKLFGAIADGKPDAVFLGGDLLPSGLLAPEACEDGGDGDFLSGCLVPGLEGLRRALGRAYPRIFLILGNDDLRAREPEVQGIAGSGLFAYMHGQRADLGDYPVYGYACVPPTPFLLKDWERYDVSRYVDPGCVSPEKGVRSAPVSESEVRYATIQQDLEKLAGAEPMERAVFLFHAPPYQTPLDRAALDGVQVDHVPLDPHVGSIAIARFIAARQPLVSLHGHIHESARLTGSWRDRIGRTHLFSAAHHGPELALVRFDLGDPAGATRDLI